MNNLAYGNQEKSVIASKVEELLRKELGSAGPVGFEVEDEAPGETSTKSVLRDVAAGIFGGKSVLLCTIHFRIESPRATALDVHVNRQGAGAFAGVLAYATSLNKRLGSEVSFGDDGKFSGDTTAAAKLNDKKDVLKKCKAFAVTEGGITGFELKIPRHLKITPQESGARLVGVTLPRSKSMGFSATFNSKEFFELVSLIEAEL